VWRSGNVQVATGATPTISLPAGTHVLTLTVTDNGGATASDAVTITVNAGVVCALPTGWLSQDIGAVGRAGSACETAGTFTLGASGSDIWGTADQFRFAYQPLGCNGEIVARLNALTNNDPWTKAGVMIRESMSANARHAMMVVSATSGAAFQYRVNTGGTTASIGRAAAVPEWVKIVRSGNTFTGYLSEDGLNWGTPVGQVTIGMSAQAFIGLALTSHNNTQLATAQLGNVSVVNSGCTTSATSVRLNTTGVSGPATGSLEVNAFPNPTDGKFRVDLLGVDANRVTTRLADATGNVYLRNRHLVIGAHMLELDIAHLQPGVYLLEVQEGSAAGRYG
jgi:hypothetical protein